MDFIKITPDYFSDVILHLRNTFFADEPLNKSVKLCKPGEGHIDLERHSLTTLEDGLSVMAVTEDKKIAGVALNGIIHSGDLTKSLISLNENNKDERFKKIFTLLFNENLKLDYFNKFKVDKIFEIKILSVDSAFRGKGLAKELLRQSEIIAKDNCFKMMKTDATGLFSQKISTSLGFQTLSEISYHSYLDENGKQIFMVDPPHDKLKIMYKLLCDEIED